jgi:NNP family nitrate/nitrite transporter-like MFS transporter
MFGLLNVVTRYDLHLDKAMSYTLADTVLSRPLGGIVSDLLYKHVSTNLWLKKGWIIFVGITAGAFLIAIGLLNPHDESTMFGLIAGMAFFLEAGNGANFALVPHVHPHANGVLSGTVGAMGNFGGVIFAILFRFHGTDYAESFWIMGCMMIGFNVVMAWVPPLPKGQIGGR